MVECVSCKNRAICKNRNGESENRMRGMMGMRESGWRMRGIRVEMREMRGMIRMQEMGVGMRGIRVGI